MKSPSSFLGAFALAVAAGCSSSSPTSPGQVGANLPGAAGAPTPRSDQSVEKLSIKGRVLDARTGNPISKATVVAYQAAEVPAADAQASQPGAVTGATDSASPSAAATADTPASRAPEPRPRPKGSVAPPVKTTADDKGDFEIKDLPPGTYSVTAYHKGYVAVSFVGGRPASGRLDVALPPQGDAVAGYEIGGKVYTLTRKPATGVMVGAALPPGLFAGAPAVSDTDGAFTLADLPSGKLLMAAWTLGDAGELRTWGVQRDVRVAYGKDKKSTPPQITLRAVSKSIVLAGKVAIATKGVRPRQVQVFLATDDGTEVPLLTRAPDQEGYFRFSLPAPEEGTTYHLVGSGVDSVGNAAYAHLHKIAGPSHSLDLALPELPATPSVATETTPEWNWSAEQDVSAYRVRIETTGDDGKTLWEGWTTGTSIALPQIGALALKHGEAYRFTVSAIRTVGPFELAEIGATPWAAAASLAPREFVAGEPYKNEYEPPPARARGPQRADTGARDAAPRAPAPAEGVRRLPGRPVPAMPAPGSEYVPPAPGKTPPPMVGPGTPGKGVGPDPGGKFMPVPRPPQVPVPGASRSPIRT